MYVFVSNSNVIMSYTNVVKNHILLSDLNLCICLFYSNICFLSFLLIQVEKLILSNDVCGRGYTMRYY